MRTNRSIPRATVIPELAYPDVVEAADWLCAAFGFDIRLRIADHRIQINVGDGALVVAKGKLGTDRAHGMMVRVENVEAHHKHAAAHGAKILNPPTDYPYGERQYTAEDPGGHVWKFTQSIADVAPEEWGGTSVRL